MHSRQFAMTACGVAVMVSTLHNLSMEHIPETVSAHPGQDGKGPSAHRGGLKRVVGQSESNSLRERHPRLREGMTADVLIMAGTDRTNHLHGHRLNTKSGPSRVDF